MSTLYHVFVSDRPSAVTVDLSIQVVHPDAMHIYDTPGFALMLLQECSKENNLLAEEVDYDTVTDAGWLKKYARGFIKRVELTEVENPLPEAARSDYEHPYWEDSENWLSGTLRITMTHPAWAQHATDGLDWESASYDPNRSYDACSPIQPSEKEAEVSNDPTDRTGFLAIPNYFFEPTLTAPTPVWIPIYGDNAYMMGDEIKTKEITDEMWDSMHGKTVYFQAMWSGGMGVLCSREQIFTIDSGSYGPVNIEGGDLKWIASADFNQAKKRLNEGLNYKTIMGWVDPYIAETKVEGDTVTFKVYSFSENRRLELQDESDVMGLLCRSVTDIMEEITDDESKLGEFLENEKEERDIYFTSEVYTKIGKGMILGYSLKKIKKASHSDLDSLEVDDLVAELAKEPWTTWKITIQVSDPAWIEHLPERGPFHYGFGRMNEVEAWEGEPIIWQKK